tara:strand:- start:24 stop:506 length:483 start_codon:yes stop_codon:yes gene_type:complete
MSKISKLSSSNQEWFFEDYQENAVMEMGPVYVKEDELIEFAIRYDPQPMHIDPEAAKTGPYEGLIASGWQTCALVMGELVKNYFSPSSSLGSPGIDELQWLKPVRPGDILTVRATILETKCSRSKPDRGLVCTLVEALNHQQEKVVSFKALNFMLRREFS